MVGAPCSAQPILQSCAGPCKRRSPEYTAWHSCLAVHKPARLPQSQPVNCTTWAYHPPLIVVQGEWKNVQIWRKWRQCFFSPTHQLTAFENQRLERFLSSGTRAKQSCSIVAGRFVFAHFRQEEQHSRGGGAGTAQVRWEEGKEPGSGSEICSGFATFPSNLRPREPLAMSPLYQCSCMWCTILAMVWLVLFWV